MKFANEKILEAKSMTLSFQSIPVQLDQIYGFNLHAIFTGSPIGTFKLQASNDDVPLASQISNWIDISGSSQAIIASGSVMWNYNGAFYRWVKVVYTAAGGSGSCDINLMSKGA